MPLRVLIADDQPDIADSLAALVALWGHGVAVAYGGVEALRLASEYVPHGLILDINMPGLSGFEVAQGVRRLPHLVACKMLAVSARSGDEHARLAADAGFDHRLTKPADPGDVERWLAAVDDAVAEAERMLAAAAVVPGG